MADKTNPEGEKAESPIIDHLTVTVPLNAYKLSYGSLLHQPQDQLFVGRDKFINEFHEILRNSRFSSGSYLISGYRGVGKTKAVEKVLDYYIKGSSSLPKWMVLLIKVFRSISVRIFKILMVLLNVLKNIFSFLIPKSIVERPWKWMLNKYEFLEKKSDCNNSNDSSKKNQKISLLGFGTRYLLWSLRAIIYVLKLKFLRGLWEAVFLEKVSIFENIKTENFKNANENKLKIERDIYREQSKTKLPSSKVIGFFDYFDPHQGLAQWICQVFIGPLILGIFLPFSWIWLVIFMCVFIRCVVKHLWLRHGIDHFQFLNCIKRIIRPVVLVKVNLSFQPLLSDKVLFNIVSLLRDELRGCVKHIFRRILYWVGLIFVASLISHYQFFLFEDLHLKVAEELKNSFVCSETFSSCGSFSHLTKSFYSTSHQILSYLFEYLEKFIEKTPRLDFSTDGFIGDWVKFGIGLILSGFFWSINYVESIYFVLVYLFCMVLIDFLNSRLLPTEYRTLRRIEKLYSRMIYSHKVDGNAGPRWFSLKWSRAQLPLDERQLESELLKILEDCRKYFVPVPFIRPDIIFVFDELDKIAKEDSSSDTGKFKEISEDIYERKKEIDVLLGTLKNLITLGQARFIFIAGREMLDSWYADQDSSSLLYESLFTRVFEIPSLLTDDSDGLGGSRLDNMIEVFVCRRLMEMDTARYLWDKYYGSQSKSNSVSGKKVSQEDEQIEPGEKTNETENDAINEAKLNDSDLVYRPFQLNIYYRYLLEIGFDKNPKLREEAKYIILTLRQFILYLSFHTWGNFKRLNTVFEDFVTSFSPIELKNNLTVPPVRSTTRFMLKIGFLDHQRILLAANIYIPLEHHLGRRLSSGDDKLKVTALGALHYILKFHKRGFSRRYLERMVEAINIHSSPHLDDIVSSLLEVVLKPFVRHIRNGFLRYRFVTGFEREIRYVTRVSDLESSSFNFSMAAAEKVKRHYKSLVHEGKTSEKEKEDQSTSAVLRGILGNFYFFEENYDQAAEYFRRTQQLCEKNVIEPDEKSDPQELNIFLITILKLANLHERRHNYKTAMALYERGCQIVNRWVKSDFRKKENGGLLNYIKSGDSKWNILLQPFICRAYLALKHGAGDHSIKIVFPKKFEDVLDDKPATWARRGRLAFFLNQTSSALRFFSRAYHYAQNNKNSERESCGFWEAVSLFSFAESLLVGNLKTLFKEIKSPSRSLEKEYSFFLNKFNDFVDLRSCPELNNCTNIDSLMKTIKCDEVISKLLKKRKQFDIGLPLLNIEHDFKDIKFLDILALLLKSSQKFKELGLDDYETRVNFKVISLWAMFLEMFPRRAIESFLIKNEQQDDLRDKYEKLLENLKLNEKWIEVVRNEAWKGISRLYHGAFGVFLLRYLNKDLGEAFEDNLVDENPGNIDTQEYERFQIQIVRDPFKYLFKNEGDSQVKKRQETAFWFRSLLGQNVLITSFWEDNFRRSILKSLSEKLNLDNSSEIKLIPIDNTYMPPYSAQNRAMALWQDARFLSSNIRDAVFKFKNKQTDDLDKEYWWNATKAVRNYYWASQTVQLISGNNQGLVIVPKFLIYYNLWELLYDLIQFELEFPVRDYSKQKRIEIRNLNIEDVEKRSAEIRNAEKEVQKQIQPKLWRKIPAHFIDYEYIKSRAIHLFREVENNGDPTNKARRNIIKTKYYIDDDFEDPQFLMEWTMNQMFSPSAYIHRRIIENTQFNLKEKWEN